MNGLELSRAYYEEFGKNMLETDFSDLLPFLAIGSVGSGSDRYGFDDDISRDHDYEPGFCIFLPGEDVVDRRRAFQLERAYSKLPDEFNGIKRQPLSPVGGNRNGVIRTSEFYSNTVGSADGYLSLNSWLTLPSYALAEAVNGEIFYDTYGEFTAIRSRLKNMPSDIKLKHLAGNILIMAQAGQYNFSRCLKHGEPEAAQFACIEFVKSAMKVCFLLNNSYMPYYKWSFRALKKISGYEKIAESLSFLLFGNNNSSDVTMKKSEIIEDISVNIISILNRERLINETDPILEKHAYFLNSKICDPTVRNLHILAAVNE